MLNPTLAQGSILARKCGGAVINVHADTSNIQDNPAHTLDPEHQNLIEGLAASNARMNAFSTRMLTTNQKLENFQREIYESNQKLRSSYQRLSNVTKRLDEIEETLTTFCTKSTTN